MALCVGGGRATVRVEESSSMSGTGGEEAERVTALASCEGGMADVDVGVGR